MSAPEADGPEAGAGHWEGVGVGRGAGGGSELRDTHLAFHPLSTPCRGYRTGTPRLGTCLMIHEHQRGRATALTESRVLCRWCWWWRPGETVQAPQSLSSPDSVSPS